MTGTKRIKLSREFIMDKISEFDIFKFYYPGEFTLNRLCLNPFVTDNNPSCIIGTKSETGEIIFKCFNSSHRGDCFNFVMYMFGVDYMGALKKIAGDFGLIDGKVDYKRIISEYKQPSIEEAHHLYTIKVKTKQFTFSDREYFKLYHLTPEDLNFCKDTKCYSVREWAIDGIKQGIKDPIFCFNLKNKRGDWVKIYQPRETKKKKWRSSIPFTEMMGVGNIQNCDIGIVTKSLKDAAFINKYITPCVEIMQAEDEAALSEENIKRIKENCKHLYISFDSDSKGCEASTAITKKLECNYINPPKELLEYGVTDWTDMCKYYNSPIPVIDFWKQKKVLV